ncbi:MAG: hypothetical protein B6244_05315 [Candidatus Cloacimonetes bacterium 4572_55]|nr:MAG: hypothetical protein B6244_05315 [Candidatus Cloacimonetes bacterium 4572_55]
MSEILTPKRRADLRSQAHKLKPAIMLGKEGVNEQIIQSVEEYFHVHELLKVKLQKSCPLSRQEVADRLSQQTEAAPVQQIGRVIVFFRPTDKE